MSTPFKTMKAIYVYLAAFVGLLVVATGGYHLLEYLLNVLFLDADFNALFIVTPLALIFTGLFIMVPHWAIGHHFHLIEHKNNGRKK